MDPAQQQAFMTYLTNMAKHPPTVTALPNPLNVPAPGRAIRHKTPTEKVIQAQEEKTANKAKKQRTAEPSLPVQNPDRRSKLPPNHPKSERPRSDLPPKIPSKKQIIHESDPDIEPEAEAPEGEADEQPVQEKKKVQERKHFLGRLTMTSCSLWHLLMLRSKS